MIFIKLLFFTLLLRNMTVFFLQQYFHKEFLFKFYDQSVNKMDFRKLLTFIIVIQKDKPVQTFLLWDNQFILGDIVWYVLKLKLANLKNRSQG